MVSDAVCQFFRVPASPFLVALKEHRKEHNLFRGLAYFETNPYIAAVDRLVESCTPLL